VQFADATLLRLATPVARDALFDQVALEHIVSAAYDTDALALEGPFSAIFDELRLAVALPDVVILDGSWTPVGTADRVDARFQVAGLSGRSGSAARIAALWRGSVVARAVPSAARIREVQVTIPSLGTIDAEIIDEEGQLPADPEAREAARRTRLLARLRLGMHQPDAISDDAVSALLSQAGAATVSELVLLHAETTVPIGMRLRYESAPAGPASPIPLPITAAVLVRDAASFSLEALLTESALVRERIAQMGVDALPRRDLPATEQVRARRSIIVVWIVEEVIFDDDDWPGAPQNGSSAAKRAARRADAGVWLAREGIGLAVA
jgi:hypothetical protein